MRTNKAGVELIKKFEGLRLEVYLDVVGIKTVGWGHVDKIMLVGEKISQARADELLKEDIERTERGINKVLKAAISDNAYSALVCFGFNVGVGNLASSTLLKKINSGDPSASNEFLRWDKAGSKVLAGLTRRRQAERDLFNS